METTIIYEVPGLKVFGKLNKRFFVERNKEVRVGRGFYDGCKLTCSIIQSLDFVVAHDGTIS